MKSSSRIALCIVAMLLAGGCDSLERDAETLNPDHARVVAANEMVGAAVVDPQGLWIGRVADRSGLVVDNRGQILGEVEPGTNRVEAVRTQHLIGYVVSGEGGLVKELKPAGQTGAHVVDQQGRIIGAVRSATGEVVDAAGKVIGRVTNAAGDVVDDTGKVIGRVLQPGDQ